MNESNLEESNRIIDGWVNHLPAGLRPKETLSWIDCYRQEMEEYK